MLNRKEIKFVTDSYGSKGTIIHKLLIEWQAMKEVVKYAKVSVSDGYILCGLVTALENLEDKINETYNA